MDLTPVFRTIAEQQCSDTSPVSSGERPPSNHLPSSTAVFFKQVSSLVQELTELDTYVHRYRQSVTELSNLYDLGSAMTRSERVRLSQLTLRVIKSCETALFRLQALCPQVDPQHAQRSEHIKEVLAILRLRLCKLADAHSSLNDAIYKRFTDVQRCCKLSHLVLGNLNNHNSKCTVELNSDDKKDWQGKAKKADTLVRADTNVGNRQSFLEELQKDYDVQYTEDELKRFHVEKQEVRARISVHKRDVELVEQKLSKLSSLQKTFAEHVLAQENCISRISDNAIIASDNVSDGNKFIKKALQRQTSTRVWLMLIMVVLTFSLWFLHWYHV